MLRRIVDSRVFSTLTVAAIVLASVIVGLLSYPDIEATYGATLAQQELADDTKRQQEARAAKLAARMSLPGTVLLETAGAGGSAIAAGGTRITAGRRGKRPRKLRAPRRPSQRPKTRD